VEYFKRQIELLGKNNQENLKKKKVAVIGCGGLGCSIMTALSCSGIGEFHLIDFDKIEIHNIHRQIAFSKNDIGKYKCEILAKSCQRRYEKASFYEQNMNFNEFITSNIDLDLIIDATDNLQTRDKIDKYCKSKNIPWIYGSVEEFNGQVAFFDKAIFGDIFNQQEPIAKSQVAPMVMQIASFQANLALRYLANLSIKKDKLYYIFYNNDGEYIQQVFGL
jgi:molybdopterin/thiamine biosynthesis adenylyltransferase